MQIELDHKLTRPAAVKQIERLLSECHAVYGARIMPMLDAPNGWNGCECPFTFRTLHFLRSRGTLEVGDYKVRIEIKLSWPLLPFRSRFGGMIRSVASRLLNEPLKRTAVRSFIEQPAFEKLDQPTIEDATPKDLARLYGMSREELIAENDACCAASFKTHGDIAGSAEQMAERDQLVLAAYTSKAVSDAAQAALARFNGYYLAARSAPPEEKAS